MNVDWLLNPWVISTLVVVFIVGNLATMKYLGTSGVIRKNPKQKSDTQRLIEIYKEKDAREGTDSFSVTPPPDTTKKE